MKVRKAIFFYVAMLSLICLSACTSNEENNVENNDYLVQAGGQGLEADIFIRRYQLSKDFADAEQIDKSKVKSFVDQFFLENLLFQAEGYRIDLYDQEIIQNQIKKNKKDLLTQTNGPLYRAITANITVTEDEIRQLYDDITNEVKIAHILVGSKPLADSLYNLVINGANFDKLG